MRIPKDNVVYLRHIIDAIEQIEIYISSHTKRDFTESEWDQAAVMRFLEIIGEAANNIEQPFFQANPEVPWRRLVNLRNVLIHDYADVNVDTVWKIITKDVLILKNQIVTLLAKLSEQAGTDSFSAKLVSTEKESES